jgi:cellulose synthase/poly-beta-1,6-N-acetylglucosamine synthase-like glycosyltransferase
MSLGFWGFVRVFWFLIVFELFRYLILDLFIVGLFYLKRYLDKNRISWAKEMLFKERPLVSIIVPGKDEGESLFKLVKSLEKQSYQHFEIILVDDGSIDNTPTIAQGLLKHGLIHKFLRNEVRGGKASAANLALRYAKGEFTIHLDADCVFDEKAIENVLFPFYLKKNLAGVGGNLEVNNYKTSLSSTLQAIEYLKVIGTGRIVTSYLGLYHIISGAFGAFRTDVLRQVGGWDIGPGLDGDITMKIRKAGYAVHFEPTAIGKTNVPESFFKLARQRLRWDRSVIRFRLRKHFDVFLPNKNFKFLNMASSAENLFYTVFLNLNWYIYMSDMLINFPSVLKHVVLLNFVLFTFSNLIKFIIALVQMKEPKKRLHLIFYLPLMVVYNGVFLRVLRTVAIMREWFLKSSYNDSWNPDKTSKWAKKLKF